MRDRAAAPVESPHEHRGSAPTPARYQPNRARPRHWQSPRSHADQTPRSHGRSCSSASSARTCSPVPSVAAGG
jgi:hypothetical protein